MKNCGNCVYKDLLITQEPCMDCLYSSNWEADDEQEDEDEKIQHAYERGLFHYEDID